MTRRRALIAAGIAAALPVARARAAEPDWPDALLLATASAGGTYYAYGLGLARVLTRDLGIAVRVRETTGPNENLLLLERGEVRLAFVTTGAAAQAWAGAAPWTGGRPLRAARALFAMYDTPFHFVVRRDATARRIGDLAGARVGMGPEGGTGAEYEPRLLADLGVEVRPVFGSWEDLAARFRAGEIDAIAVAAGAPFPAIAGLEAQRAIRYLTLSRAEVARARLAAPELGASVIPAGTYPSLMADYETVGLYNLAVAHERMPQSLAFEIVRAVFDSHAEMMEAHPAAAATVPGNFVRNAVLPWHPGALRYYASRGGTGVLRGD
ncbi:TAXI family TRAP transporter solute-binding subunit [Neoroseomonas soli]|uniref:TAXI family TRAP transporter solute-binding subunit n=1 Tax=Neoroseomonas soli TaxID=1081025 RepID=A0A9X9WYH3_9PROT|nr:TAXI family TRAP transporter solute-binding subunit [Neoroseomonas soli]MBR0672202.1 TAXI family TRAP transporter solute-binding subunit [Neoroseomonas soli]